MLSEYITSSLVGISVSPQREESLIMLSVPLYKQMYSINRAMIETVKAPLQTAESVLPFTFIPELYNRWLPVERLSFPFNATALVFNGTHMMTFDGTVLRVPRSRCKVLLTSIPGVADVSMSHPQPTSPPEITFQSGHTHASISPDLSVKLNGQSVNNGEKTVSTITVIVTPQHIMMESPLLGITLLKESRVLMVNVSGWVFNHTQGLLGSYDGEMANDWYTRQGTNASSLHELVTSWQEDASCPTPDINPVNPASVHVMKAANCHFSLGMKSLCSPVVNPEPFLHMCYGSMSPQHAAAAYRTQCSRLNVPSPPPFP